MLRHILRPATLAAAVGALSVLTLTDPRPSDGERALLGQRSADGASTLRLTSGDGQVSADRALLGRLPSSDEGAGTGPVIRLRSAKTDGASVLLGR